MYIGQFDYRPRKVVGAFRWPRGRHGFSAIEYALVAAILGTAFISLATPLKQSLFEAFCDAGEVVGSYEAGSTCQSFTGVSRPYRGNGPSSGAGNTPSSFVFFDADNTDPGAPISSNAVTLSGFTGSLTAEFSGDEPGGFTVDGGALVTSASVSPGNRVRLIMNAPPGYSDAATASLEIAGVSDDWTIRTRPPDTTLDPISFPDVTNATPGNLVTSATRTASGIDAPVSLSLSGAPSGEILVNGSVSGRSASVFSGDSIAVRLQAPASAGATATLTLSGGGQSVAWSVETN